MSFILISVLGLVSVLLVLGFCPFVPSLPFLPSFLDSCMANEMYIHKPSTHSIMHKLALYYIHRFVSTQSNRYRHCYWLNTCFSPSRYNELRAQTAGAANPTPQRTVKRLVNPTVHLLSPGLINSQIRNEAVVQITSHPMDD